MPTYAQLWTCRAFAMLLCKLQLQGLGTFAGSPKHPMIVVTLFLAVPSLPAPRSPRLLTV